MPKSTKINAAASTIALRILGGEYGYFSSHLIPPNTPGYATTGSLVRPPRIGPIMTPILAVMGRIKNALDWNLILFNEGSEIQIVRVTHFFSLIISDTMVRMTPTLPFKAPPRLRNIKACVNVVENPKPMQDKVAPARPKRITFFLPHRSDIWPHSIAVHSWAAAKAHEMIPAWEAIVESDRFVSKDLSW